MNRWEARTEAAPSALLRQSRERPRPQALCEALDARMEAFAALQKKRYAVLAAEVLQLTQETQAAQSVEEQERQARAGKMAALTQRFEQGVTTVQRTQTQVKQRLLDRISLRARGILEEHEGQAEARSETSRRLGEDAQADLHRLADALQAAERETETQSGEASSRLDAGLHGLYTEFEALQQQQAQLEVETAEQLEDFRRAAQFEAEAEGGRRAATEQRVLVLLEAVCDKVEALS